MTVVALKDIQNVNDMYVLSRWRKDVYQRYSNIIFVGGYPHMTDEYKKFQEVEKHFQECTNLTMGSVKKMEFIKERCIQMRNELLNWNPTMTSNVDGFLRTSQRTEVDSTPILDPRVANPSGRPWQACYMSMVEARGRGRRGKGRGIRTSSRVGGASGGRGVATSSPTAQENNDESFSFDLNEEPIGSHESFVF
ncbi:hypothetical protein ACS0TY_013522 [Phlomoides rotata]